MKNEHFYQALVDSFILTFRYNWKKKKSLFFVNVRSNSAHQKSQRIFVTLCTFPANSSSRLPKKPFKVHLTQFAFFTIPSGIATFYAYRRHLFSEMTQPTFIPLMALLLLLQPRKLPIHCIKETTDDAVPPQMYRKDNFSMWNSQMHTTNIDTWHMPYVDESKENGSWKNIFSTA